MTAVTPASPSRDASLVTSDADRRLLQPFRAVRHVSAADVPWPGMLVRTASGDSLLLVDVRELPDGWTGWRADPEGHLLGAVDIVRHADGHSAALPLCTERVEDFLARRAAARVPLSTGELITIAVSLVRAAAALDPVATVTGEWWLTDAGRPVLATEAAALDAPVRTAELLRALATGTRCDTVLLAAAEAVAGARRSGHELRLIEEQLFAIATPEPLATSLLGPRAARDLYTFDREPVVAIEPDERRSSWIDTIARSVDADLGEAVSRVTTGLWRRMRSARATTRKPWLLAGGTAAVVIAVGLLWPTNAGGPATADVQAPAVDSATAGVAPTPTGDTGDTASPTPSAAATDLVSVTDGLLRARTACGEDRACLSGLMRDPSSRFETGPIDFAPDERTITLLDDFGGMAVLRVAAADAVGASQLVVVMLDDGRWLLRDVHTAKQP